MSLTICARCNATDNYFLNGLSCSPCEIEGCINCESLLECRECDEEKGYNLKANLKCVKSEEREERLIATGRGWDSGKMILVSLGGALVISLIVLALGRFRLI